MDWETVARSCADIMTAAIDAVLHLSPRAKTLTQQSAYPTSEHDAQNLFYLALKPWLRDVEREPFQIRYGGQRKSADLAAVKSQLVIEVKYVRDRSSAAAIQKQLSGLAEMYSQPNNCKAIVFVILVCPGILWDNVRIDSDHSIVGRSPIVLTRSIRLSEPPS
jgi:hypothetical protein